MPRLVILAVAAALAVSQTVGYAAMVADPPREALKYQRDLVRTARYAWGPDAPIAAFAGQIHQESGWNPYALSRIGAQGMAQFMPATSRWIAEVYPDLVDGSPSDPRWAMRALVRYDRWLWDRVKADDACERMAFALSAYNGGLGYVYRRQKASPQPGVCFDATCRINPGIHPSNQRENEDYPARILKRHQLIYANWGETLCLGD